MDITPQLLKDIRLSQSFHGYNRDEVDELIERVGAAIVQLQGRLRDALDRAETAEARALTMGTRSESEETLRRTLVLAQRTADAAIAEANIEAARTVSDANEHAARTVGEANERASRLLSDTEGQAAALRTETEAEVRRIAEDSRAPLMDDIRELERVRSFLRDDIELLERHLGAQRDRLRAQVGELTRIVEEPSMLRLDPVPATSGVDTVAVLTPRDLLATIAPPKAPLSPAFVSPAMPPPIVGAIDDADDADDYADDDVSYEPFDGRAAVPVSAAPTQLSGPTWADDDDFDEGYDAGPPTRALGADDAAFDAARGGAPFLDQLRRAVDDEVGLGEGTMSDFFSDDVDENPRSRFGRRR